MRLGDTRVVHNHSRSSYGSVPDRHFPEIDVDPLESRDNLVNSVDRFRCRRLTSPPLSVSWSH